MADKEIRFTDIDNNTLFTIPDGGNVIVTHSSGEQHVMTCTYVDENHFETLGARYRHDRYVAMLADRGATVAPETVPKYNAGYRIVVRRPANDLVIVLGNNPRAPTPWVTWQASRDTPTDYYWGIYRAERLDAVADLDTRARTATKGSPYPANKENEKQIRFIDPHYKTLFMLPDGGNIVIAYPDSEERVAECKFLDECHTAIDGECYHICQFAEIMQNVGATYEPEIAPAYVDGYHVIKLRNERDQTIFLGHMLGAELPWVTWQQDMNAGVSIQGGHYYSKRYDARKDYDQRTYAVRNGRPCVPYVPEADRKKARDMGVPS